MFQSAHSYTSLKNGTNLTDEHFRTVDVLARFYPWRRLQVLTLVPYHDFQRSEKGVHTRARGIGDASLLLNYVLLDTGDSLRHAWRHTLTLGGGVKPPTGKHNLEDQEGIPLNPNLQPGTGSKLDYFVSATYTLHQRVLGPQRRRAGPAEHRQPEKLPLRQPPERLGQTVLLEKYPPRDAAAQRGSIQRRLGCQSGPNEVDNTGGYVSLATLGLDVFGAFSAGFTFQQPVCQNLGGGAIRAEPLDGYFELRF